MAFMTLLLLSVTVTAARALAVDDSADVQSAQTLDKGETINGPGFFAGNRL